MSKSQRTKPNPTPMAVNPIATVTSDGQPQPGQSHRSSGNFSTETATEPKKLQWWVTDNDHSSDITFDVMEDESFWPDSTIFRGVTSGSITDYYSDRSLYIANPENTGGKSFGVQAWPYNG